MRFSIRDLLSATLVVVMGAEGCPNAARVHACDGSKPVAVAPAETWKFRADKELAKKEYDAAIKIYDAELRERPKNVDALIARAYVKMAKGILDGSRQDAEAVLQIAPRDGRSWRLNADLFAQEQKHDEAIVAYARALELGLPAGEAAAAHQGRAMELGILGRHRDALNDWNQVIRLDPDSVDARLERAAARIWLGEADKALADIDQCLKAEPNSSRAWELRTHVWLATGQFEKVTLDADRLIKLEPTVPDWRAIRGAALLKLGKFEEASLALQTAVDLGSRMPLAKRRPKPPEPLSEAALKHGRAQARAMLRDRPAMATHVVEGDALWNWATRQFAGETAGNLIYWDNAPPTSRFDAESEIAPGEQLRIRIAAVLRTSVNQGKPASFEDLWSSAVFELYNCTSGPEFEELVAKAADGRLGKNQYAFAALEMEESAVGKTRQFYVSVFLPWARKTKFADTDPRVWNFNRWAPPERADREVYFRDDPRWEYWADDWEWRKLESLYLRQSFADCRRHAETLLAQDDKSDPEKTARWHYWKGTAHLALNESKSAIDAYSQALRSDPKLPGAWIGRATAHLQASSPAEAVADLTQAIALEPDSLESYALRGNAWVMQSEWQKAADDFGKCIKLEPKNATTYFGRAQAWNGMKSHNTEVADLDEALRLDPNFADAYHARGAAQAELGKYSHALADFKKHIELAPESPTGHLARAHLLITCDDAKIRNCTQAVADATRACELTKWQDAYAMAVLAAAYAECGKSVEAVKWQTKARDVAPAESRKDYETALDLYKNGKTIRDAPKKTAGGSKSTPPTKN